MDAKERIVAIKLLERQKKRPLYMNEIGVSATMRTMDNVNMIQEKILGKGGYQKNEGTKI
jgi:hypothetical protein